MRGKNAYRELTERDRRMCALRATAEGNGTSNSSIIRSLFGHYGLGATQGAVDGTLRWLEERGLVRLVDLGNIVRVHVTDAGREVATGAVEHPDITLLADLDP